MKKQLYIHPVCAEVKTFHLFAPLNLQRKKISAYPVPWRKTGGIPMGYNINYKDSYSIYNHRYCKKKQDVPNNPAFVFTNRYMRGVCRCILRKSPPHWVNFSPTITCYAVCAAIPFQPPQPNLPQADNICFMASMTNDMRPLVSSAPAKLKSRSLFHVVPCDWSKLWSPPTATGNRCINFTNPRTGKGNRVKIIQ